MEQFEFHPHRELTMPEHQHDEFDDKFDRNDNPDGNEEFDDPSEENPDENPNADSLNAELHALIQQGLPYPENSPQRRKIKNAIARKIQQSGQLLRRDSPDYEDALSLTWRYFLRNLWEADTADAFSDPACKILHRLNKYLKFRLRDAEQNAREERQQQQQRRSPDGEWMDIAESIPAPEPDPEDVPDEVELEELESLDEMVDYFHRLERGMDELKKIQSNPKSNPESNPEPDEHQQLMLVAMLERIYRQEKRNRWGIKAARVLSGSFPELAAVRENNLSGDLVTRQEDAEALMQRLANVWQSLQS